MQTPEKIKKKRIFYTKLFKRTAILRLVKGENASDILKALQPNADKLFESDKKYASKLIHKWRKEIYSNRTMLNITAHKFETEDLIFERNLTTYSTDGTNDEVHRIIKTRFKNILEKKIQKYRKNTAK